MRKNIMSSKSDYLTKQLGLKKFVINALRRKCNRNIGKNKLNIPKYLVDEMKHAMRSRYGCDNYYTQLSNNTLSKESTIEYTINPPHTSVRSSRQMPDFDIQSKKYF